MIKQGDANDFSDSDDLSCNFHVGRAGFDHAGRVVVRQNDRRRAVTVKLHRRVKHPNTCYFVYAVDKIVANLD